MESQTFQAFVKAGPTGVSSELYTLTLNHSHSIYSSSLLFYCWFNQTRRKMLLFIYSNVTRSLDLLVLLVYLVSFLFNQVVCIITKNNFSSVLMHCAKFCFVLYVVSDSVLVLSQHLCRALSQHFVLLVLQVPH